MFDKITVSFPGLGIDPFSLNKIAFSIGKFEVRWYGVIITCGIILAFLYAFYRGKNNEGVAMDDVIDVGLVTVLMGIAGARLYYVLTTLDSGIYESFYDVIAIWNGGLAIYGGIIGGCLGILLMCHIKRIRWQKLFDMIAPGVVIAQSLGRWGNFFNGEAYGYAIEETTRYYFFTTEHILPSGEGTLFHALRMGLGYKAVTGYYHPTFLYESLWNLVGFVLIHLLYKHKKFDGQVALMYFTWYGFGRMFIEGFRTDSLYVPGTEFLRISQCVGLLCFLGGAVLLTVFLIRAKGKPYVFAVQAANATVETTQETRQTEAEKTENEAAPEEVETAENNPTEDTEETQNGKID